MTESQIPTAPQMASLAAAAAETLGLLAGAGGLAGPDAAEVTAELGKALAHIAEVINSEAVKAALPHAAQHLGAAAAQAAAAARTIRQVPAPMPAGRPLDFPSPARPAPRAAGGVREWRPIAGRAQAATPGAGGTTP